MAPLPLAVVMSSFEAGGTERQMIELVRRLDRTRWRVEVACLRPRGAWLDRVADTAPITVFPVTSLRRPSVLRQLYAFARWCRERVKNASKATITLYIGNRNAKGAGAIASVLRTRTWRSVASLSVSAFSACWA